MSNQSNQYYVGIDLGTTHTAVAYAHSTKKHDIQLFQINQLISPGQVAERALLPSARYHAAAEELAEADTVFSGEQLIIGEAARLLGAKTKGRLVASAKSWLSHPSIDHNADILPWGSAEEIAKVSPVDASASYLNHVRTVWNQRFPDAPLELQDIVITVPASFDETARALTLQAADKAGLKSIKLLEEPQAVCYDWLHRHSGNLAEALAGIHLLLVLDVGGGTTDMTLIKVEHGQTEPKLTRIAVGDHILLGGDNIDLALAHLVETRLVQEASRLPAADFSALTEQCRIAKEHMLADNAPNQWTITLLGSGSKLIGASRSTVLSQDEVKQIALDGFFPLTAIDELPEKKRSAVVEFGLPYSAEPAISKHIAAFLQLHKNAAKDALHGNGIVPDAILLNGGLFKSSAISQRILELLSNWRGKPVRALENIHPELSVAYGAVNYAIARRGKKAKIGGGAARSYFLIIETAPNGNSAGPELHQKYGICVLPKGSPEEQEIILHNRRFELKTGAPVRFDLVSCSGDNLAKAGDIVEITDEYHALPPFVITFTGNSGEINKETIVELGVTLTELGTLKIQCIDINAAQFPGQNTDETGAHQQKRWNVEFQIRKQHASRQLTGIDLPPQITCAIDCIQAVFGPKSKNVNPNAVKNLRPELEKTLGKERSEWDTHLLRTLFSALLEGLKYRRRSEHHERVWLSLAGYCLRPGFGHPLDEWRTGQICSIYQQGIQFTNEIQNWSEWWTLWRRIAGGLDETLQVRIYDDIANYINPASSRQPNVAKQAKQRSFEDMVRLGAVLERLSTDKKVQQGEWLLKRLEKSGEAQQFWWALGRLAARIPFYGNHHNVIAPEIAEQWLNAILKQDWKKNTHAAFAATLICRKSGDRVRDIDESLRQTVIDKLTLSKTPLSWREIVTNIQELDAKEEIQFYGETLPPGLKLLHVDN